MADVICGKFLIRGTISRSWGEKQGDLWSGL